MDRDTVKSLSATIVKVRPRWWLLVVCAAILLAVALSRGWSWRAGVPLFLFVSTCYLALRDAGGYPSGALDGHYASGAGEGSSKAE